MNNMRSQEVIKRIARRLSSAGLLWALLLGCRGGTVEEAEHHTPPHKPPDYPAAVDRLVELHQEIRSGRSRETHQLDVFTETYDVVRWLPELAADSDLKEGPWNRVHAAARRLEAILTEVLARGDDGRREAYLQSETELDQRWRELVEIKQHFAPFAETLAESQEHQHPAVRN